MTVRIVDSLTDRAFMGNPAADCLLEGSTWPGDDRMRAVAPELSVPMTAFALHLDPTDPDAYGLRWLNASTEERLCGHATLATAFALHEHRGYAGTVRCSRVSGVHVVGTDEDGAVQLDRYGGT